MIFSSGLTSFSAVYVCDNMPLDNSTCLGVYISSIFTKAAEVRGEERDSYISYKSFHFGSQCMYVSGEERCIKKICC